MNSSISTITVDSISDHRLVLSNSHYAAKLASSWNSILIGVRLSIEDVGYSLVGPPRLHIGLCSDPNDELTNCAVGSNAKHVLTSLPNTTLSYTTGSPNRYNITASNNHLVFKKVGGTESSVNITPANNCISADPAVRSPIFIIITKGSPNFTLSYRAQASTGTFFNPTQQQMIDAMNAANINTYWTGQGLGSLTTPVSGSIAVDEATNGSLNSLYVAWRSYRPVLYLSDFLFKILS